MPRRPRPSVRPTAGEPLRAISRTRARQPRSRTVGMKTVVDGCSLISNISVTGQATNLGSVLLSQMINPVAFSGSISEIAQAYDNFRFRKLTFYYVPMVAKTQAGSLAIYYDPDCRDIPSDVGGPANVTVALSHRSNCLVSVSDEASLPCYLGSGPMLFTDLDAGDSSIERRTYLQGSIYVIWNSDPPATTFTVGTVLVDYEIEFENPNYEVPVESLSVSAGSGTRSFMGNTIAGGVDLYPLDVLPTGSFLGCELVQVSTLYGDHKAIRLPYGRLLRGVITFMYNLIAPNNYGCNFQKYVSCYVFSESDLSADYWNVMSVPGDHMPHSGATRLDGWYDLGTNRTATVATIDSADIVLPVRLFNNLAEPLYIVPALYIKGTAIDNGATDGWNFNVANLLSYFLAAGFMAMRYSTDKPTIKVGGSPAEIAEVLSRTPRREDESFSSEGQKTHDESGVMYDRRITLPSAIPRKG